MRPCGFCSALLGKEPTNSKAQKKAHLASKMGLYGAINGARTHDNRNHNPGLYQLSYDRHKARFKSKT